MNFGVYLAHGDAKLAWMRYTHGFGDGEWVDEGGELEDVQHRDGLARGVGSRLLGGRHLCMSCIWAKLRDP